MVFADFESLTRKITHAEPRDNHSYMIQHQKHIPSGFCYYIKCSFDSSYNKKVIYTKQSEDKDISRIFVEKLEHDIRRIYHKFKFSKKMVLIEEDEANFEKANKCHICEKLLGKDESEIIAILQANLGVRLIMAVTLTTRYRNSSLSYFTI